MVVGARPITIIAEAKNKLYGDPEPELKYNLAEGSSLIGTDAFTGSLTREPGENVGAYPINNTLILSNSSNYTLTYTGANLVINKAPLTVTADPASREYGSTSTAFTATISGFKRGELIGTSGVTGSPTFTTNATATSSVAGSPYNITPAIGSLSAANYDFPAMNFVNGNLTITKAILTVKANDIQWYSNQQAPSQSVYTSTITGFKNGESFDIGTITYTLGSAYQLDRPRTYVINPFVSTSIDNYTLNYATGTLYVNDDKAKRITTALNCVEKLATPIRGFGYRAKFTWNNQNNTTVFVPIGDKNFIRGTVGTYDATTPPTTVFTKGSGTFELLFDGTRLEWVLVTNSLNTNTQSTSAPEASATSIKCAIGGVAANGQLQLGNQMVDQTISVNKYAVYPNPASGRLTVTSALQSLKATDIAIYDLQGKLYAAKSSRQVTSNKVELDISSFANGVYMIG